MNGKLDFLTSRRFWCLILIAVIKVLDTEGILSSLVANALITILGGFTIIRTVDRFGEKAGGE